MSTNNHLVSVILCTYNDEAYLSEAMESILNQSYKNIEFIIVNDGSTDQTKAIIQNCESDKIRYYEHTENRGQEDAKNLGLSKARGKYIAYMDGDDISEKDRIKTQVDFLESHPDIGVCSTGITFFGMRNDEWYGPETDENIRLKCLSSTPMTHATCMIRASIIKQHNIRYEKGNLAAEDYLFILNLLEKTRVYCIQKPLYRYRWHGNNISLTRSKTQQENFMKLSRLAYQKLLRIKLSEQEHQLLIKLFQGKIRLEEANIIRPVLAPQLAHKSNNDFIKLFQQKYHEKLVALHDWEGPKGIPTLISFWKSKSWKFLPIKDYYTKYALIISKSIYRSIIKQVV